MPGCCAEPQGSLLQPGLPSLSTTLVGGLAVHWMDIWSLKQSMEHHCHECLSSMESVSASQTFPLQSATQGQSGAWEHYACTPALLRSAAVACPGWCTAMLHGSNGARPCPVWAAGKHAPALQVLAQVLRTVQAARKSGLAGVPQCSPSNPCSQRAEHLVEVPACLQQHQGQSGAMLCLAARVAALQTAQVTGRVGHDSPCCRRNGGRTAVQLDLP